MYVYLDIVTIGVHACRVAVVVVLKQLGGVQSIHSRYNEIVMRDRSPACKSIIVIIIIIMTTVVVVYNVNNIIVVH